MKNLFKLSVIIFTIVSVFATSATSTTQNDNYYVDFEDSGEAPYIGAVV